MSRLRRAFLVAGIIIPVSLHALAAEGALETFEACWAAVKRSFYDPNLHGVDWEAVRERYRPLAGRARSGRELRELLNRMLAELGTSHTTVLHPETYRILRAELGNRRYLTYGLLMEELYKGFFFVRALFEGGPAETAGIKVGDRIVLINGVAPDMCSEVIDAGYDPGLPSPPMYWISALEKRTVRILLQPRTNAASRREVVLVPTRMNAVDAAKNSITVIERDGLRLGTMHLWYCSRGIQDLLRDALEGPLRGCDALILDLRGRGGFPHVATQVLEMFHSRAAGRWRSSVRTQSQMWEKPVVFLIDGRSRSAKEVMAHIIKVEGIGPLVGEHTEGAVLGGGYMRLPNGSYLELAIANVSVRGVRLEGTGVEPHHEVKRRIPFSEGVDVIFERGCEIAVKKALQRLAAAGTRSF